MILLISNFDYANFGHDAANALRSVGVDCLDVKYMPHKFNYPTQSTVTPKTEIMDLVKKSDIVVVMHSDLALLALVKRCDYKRLVVFHTGSSYRQNSEQLNKAFNPVVDMSLIALGEFAGLGAKNEVYSVGAIDTDLMCPIKKRRSNPVKIYHLPSNPKVKGTGIVLKIMKKLNGKFEFRYKLEQCDYDQQLEMMQECDIYIELFAPFQYGKPYGSWGITALEAAAMGKIVFTNHTSREVYRKAYGIYPHLEAHDMEYSFESRLKEIINNPKCIPELQKNTRKWVVDYHSYKSTGMRLAEILLNN